MTERDELAELRAALSTACAQRDTYRAALRQIAALRPGAGSSKLHRIVEIARSALEGTDD